VGRTGLALAGAHGSRVPRRRPASLHSAGARAPLRRAARGGIRRAAAARRLGGLGVSRSRRIARPLGIGLLSGLAFWALLLILRFSLHNGVSAETRATDAFLLSFYFWTLVLALAAQLMAGAFAAFRSRNPDRLVDALAAGFVAGSLATLGIVGGPSLASCIDPVALNPAPCAWTVSASFSWDVFRQVVAQGAIGSLAGGGLALGLRALIERRRSDELSAAGVPS